MGESWKVIQGDCLEVLQTLSSNSVETVITDPPYGLAFMGKRWDYQLPPVEVWEECLRVAKPGAMLLAFGGTRTFHRLACSIEDAGWEIRDCLSWLYGSGFPKSHDISKAIDRAKGAQRQVVGDKGKPRGGMGKNAYGPWAKQTENPLTAPATDL